MNNNTRIIKNTLLLYLRMLFLMLLSLYTSRITLQVLGVEDFGIYNIIGSVVTLFSFVQISIINSSQRFISYALGKKNEDQIKNTFNLIQLTHLLLAIIILIFLETIGLWFISYNIKIPQARIFTALIVYQISIASIILDFLNAPYNALLISRENMKAFAYIDIIGALLKLICVICISHYSHDRLILYSSLIFSISLLQRILYQIYCKRHYKEAVFQWYWNKKEFKELMQFSSWTTLSALSLMIQKQGITIIINWFIGVTANAAVGLANQASGAINKFTSNFQQAFVPQIVKSYAEGNLNRSKQLVFTGAKICTILLLYLAIPVIFECKIILNLWLKEYPDMTIIILQLILIDTIIRSVTYSMQSAIRATGRIKSFEMINNTILFIGVILSYAIMSMGGNIKHLFGFQIIISIISSIYIIHRCGVSINFKPKEYFSLVIIRMISCTIITITALMPIHFLLSEGILRLITITIVNTILVTITVFSIGLTPYERNICITTIKNRLIHK